MFKVAEHHANKMFRQTYIYLNQIMKTFEKIELYKEADDLIESKFNILLKLNVRDFDINKWDVLIEELNRVKKETFAVNDRIVISHMDTDY